MVDYEKKEIYSYEGKTNNYLNQGLDELEDRLEGINVAAE